MAERTIKAFRVVTDMQIEYPEGVDEQLMEATLQKNAANIALSLRWSTVRDYRTADIQLQHYGMREIPLFMPPVRQQAEPRDVRDASPSSSPGSPPEPSSPAGH